MKQRFCLMTSVFIVMTAVCAGATTSSITGVFNWATMGIDAEVRLNLRSLGVSLPTGRSRAEERLFSEYYANIQPFIYSIPVDSSSVLGDFVERGELTPAMVETLARKADMIPPAISTDIQNITASYRISLSEVCSTLIRHHSGAEFPSVVNPKPVQTWTGIIIIARDELPVHGRNSTALLQPCLFPKIWDTDMNLVFDKKHTNPALYRDATMVNYMGSSHIFRRTASGLSPEIERIVGNKPLRIIARRVFGINPTDPVIDSEDALLILSSEENKRLLREGRIAIIPAESVLKKELHAEL
ncbi:MAG: polymerase [Spirochaetaceae bacterium]|jgi:hypothetical protein|nr:polymerase [Spirochaetaceae bacterium]